MAAGPFLHRPTAQGSSSGFPWKLIAALLIVTAGAILGGRAYMVNDRGEDRAASAPARTAAAPVVATTRKPASTTGILTVDSVPAGARVLLNGTAAGTTPLRLEGLPPGRHTVTLVTETGSVKRTVTVAAGKTVALDVPVFSGWVAIFAPILLDIAEGGRSLGTTEQGRILLPPGRHVLTLSNQRLGYSSTHTVEIGAGEETPLNLTPTGRVNLNAQPWAEVWVDGVRAGETPIAHLEVPLGTREFVFKHPDHGERKVTATITAKPSALTVDFTKPDLAR